MKFDSKVHANWRAPICAALIGSGIGVALGSAYLAGGMARAATDHSRASRLAAAASGHFSESILQREAAAMDPGALRVARRHDPFTSAGSPDRDRQNTLLAARLEKTPVSRIALRGEFSPTLPAGPYRLIGALDSSRELECMTQAVYFEARGETPAGQAAVAQVVLNRVRHPAFPKSVCGVVFQGAGTRIGCQFSFACDGSMRRGKESAAWNRAQRVASRALSGVVMASVGDATHFHTVNVAPNWGPRMIRTAAVGLHVFYKLGRGGAVDNRPIYANATLPPAAPEPRLDGEIRLASATLAPAEAEAMVVTHGTGAPLAAQTHAPVEAKGASKPSEPLQVTPTKAPRAVDAAEKSPV